MDWQGSNKRRLSASAPGVIATATAGFLLTGCAVIGDNSAAHRLNDAEDLLESSGQFSAISSDAARTGEDYPVRAMRVHEFDAVLADHADVDEVGELIAESIEEHQLAPNIAVDGTTKLRAFQRTGEHPELDAESWTELVELARETDAIEVQLGARDGDVTATLATWTREYPEAFDLVENWQTHERPAGVDHFEARVESGTAEHPLERSAESPWLLVEETSISGPLGPQTAQARELIATAESVEEFDRIDGFTFITGEIPNLELIVHDEELYNLSSSDREIPQDLIDASEAYADEVERVLDTDSNVSVKLLRMSRDEIYTREY